MILGIRPSTQDQEEITHDKGAPSEVQEAKLRRQRTIRGQCPDEKFGPDGQLVHIIGRCGGGSLFANWVNPEWGVNARMPIPWPLVAPLNGDSVNHFY